MSPLVRVLRVGALLLLPLAAFAATREVLVGTTPTLIPRTASTTSLVLYNNGPDDICCAQTSDGGAPPNCIPIAPGGNLALDIPTNQPVRCSAANAQTADAGTRVMELF